MPDWTYSPVLEPVLRRLPQGRQRALRSATRLAELPGGERLIRRFAWSLPMSEIRTQVLGRRLVSPFGADAAVDPTGRSAAALSALGCGFVEVEAGCSPPAITGLILMRWEPGSLVPQGISALIVELDHLPTARETGLPVLVLARDAAAMTAADGVVITPDLLDQVPADTVVYVPDGAETPAEAVGLIARGATLVGLSSGLRKHGPGLPQRCNEALASTHHVPQKPTGVAWIGALLIGVALLATGIGAAIISFGPVLLGYDKHFLHGGTRLLNHGRLLDFIQHDRITFAGVGLSIGILYTGLAWFGIRTGWRWAHTALVVSCVIGMLTLFLFFGFGYFEPLHAAVTSMLVPLLFLANRPRPAPTWIVRPEPADDVRRRALVGQLLLVVVAIGLIGGGVVISIIAVTDVFVSTDVTFIGITPHALAAISDRIIPFVAHDRAGFGGALIAQGLAMLGLTLWGFRPGERWVWWTLLLAAVASGAPTIAIHWAIGYTSFSHLAPVYLAALLSGIALALCHGYLTDRTAANH